MARTKSGIVYRAPKEHGWRDEDGYFTVDTSLPGGELATYDVSLKMYDPMLFKELAEVSETDRIRGLPHAGNSIEIMAILDGAARADNSEDAVNARKFFRQGLRRKIWALSQVFYTPKEEPDKIVHNVGSEREYSVGGDFTGENFWISDENIGLKERRFLREVFGRYGVKRINETSQKINSTDTYIWRNSKPYIEINRGVGFDADSGKLNLDCGMNLWCEWSTFRVLRAE